MFYDHKKKQGENEQYDQTSAKNRDRI